MEVYGVMINMMKKTHLLFGIAFFLVCNLYFNFPLEFSIFALVGAMLPDLDLKWKHRKVLHNLWVLGVIILTMFYFEISEIAIVIFSLGFISHLLADSLTKMGISWLWPIRFPHLEGGITTGSWKESVFSFIILIFIVIMLLGIDFIFNLTGLII